MKSISLLMFLVAMLAVPTVPAFAQNTPSKTPEVPQAVAPGCGAPVVTFAVKTHDDQHPFPPPDAGKARVYFIADDSHFYAIRQPTTRAGLDGHWIGATHGSSYFYFSVEPGEHHLCASWQGKKEAYFEAAAPLKTEAGQRYFFRVGNTFISVKGRPFADPLNIPPMRTMRLKQVNADEGQLLASEYAFATSHREP